MHIYSKITCFCYDSAKVMNLAPLVARFTTFFRIVTRKTINADRQSNNRAIVAATRRGVV
jgi:hypothetical protein